MITAALTRPRLLDRAGTASNGADLTSHHRRHGPLPAPAGLVEAVRAAGLTGHGGAGFPTWRKLATVAAAAAETGREPVVVANAAEGEPASHKDRALLRYAPHLVLDGLRLAAGAVGARRGYLYLPPRYADGMRSALAQRQGSGWDRLPVELVGAPPGFVSGEESAVLARIAGGPAVPADRYRPVAESGLRGSPSLVQNVETLAHLALIARHGPDWFRATGTAEEPGTFLATIGGAVGCPGVYEAGYGVRLDELLALAGGPVAPAGPGCARRRLPRAGAGRPARRSGQPGRVGAVRRRARCRRGDRAAGRRLRAARHRRDRVLPRRRVDRPMWTVPQRAARHRAGVRPALAAGMQRVDPAPDRRARRDRGRARRMPAPGRDRPAGAQRAAYLCRRGAPARERRMLPTREEVTMARLHIDWTRCDRRGSCAELLPELLAEDQWGYPLARDGSREPTVPDRLAERAAGGGPLSRLALRLVTD